MSTRPTTEDPPVESRKIGPSDPRSKMKDALLKKRFTDRQIGVAYDYLTRTDHDVMGGLLGLATTAGGSIRSRPMQRPLHVTRFSTSP